MFPLQTKINLFKSAVWQNSPAYVQFYITSRCNLTCQQCNIRYTNADVRECTLEEIKKISENFAKIGVGIVLLTGGEPFTRVDLPEIIREFCSQGIHVRMQTNGLASKEAIHKAIEYGGRDISISLDSLNPLTQEKINGGFPYSWHKAIESISIFSDYLPKKNSFASFGCVLQRDNLNDIEDVIRFGTEIGWFTSLVPIHVSDYFHPLGFRTYDKRLLFKPHEYKLVDNVIERIRNMRNTGYLLYDSDQYLDDIKCFVKKRPTTWRSKNGNICDSPNLYFSVLPNGDFAPCCDWRLPRNIHTYDSDFPYVFKQKIFRKEVYDITSVCNGCMYGSYPEITISMRFFHAKLQRFLIFMKPKWEKKWPILYNELLAKTEKIRKFHKKSIDQK